MRSWPINFDGSRHLIDLESGDIARVEILLRSASGHDPELEPIGPFSTEHRDAALRIKRDALVESVPGPRASLWGAE